LSGFGQQDVIMSKETNEIARQLYAMSAKKRDADLIKSMRDERYQRTFTDELFPHKARPGFKPVDMAQAWAWEELARRGER
jgi:hypothetical protein